MMEFINQSTFQLVKFTLLFHQEDFFFFFCGHSSLVYLHPPSDNVIKVNVDGSSIGR